jgi:hypothetical protein
VCYYVATNRFLCVSTGKHCAAVHLCDNLIADHDGNPKLVCYALEMAQKFCKTHLPGWQLTSTWEVCPIQGRCRVNHKQSKSVFTHESRRLFKQSILLVSTVCSCICYVVKHFLFIKAESLSNRHKSFWPESSLRVNIHSHTCTTSILDWQLASHAKGMT